MHQNPQFVAVHGLNNIKMDKQIHWKVNLSQIMVIVWQNYQLVRKFCGKKVWKWTQMRQVLAYYVLIVLLSWKNGMEEKNTWKFIKLSNTKFYLWNLKITPWQIPLSSKSVITSDPTTVCRHGGNDQ